MKRIFKAVLIVGALVALFTMPAGAMGGVMVLGTVASASTINAMVKNFNALFNEALAALQPQWPAYAMRVNSGGASEDYQWLADTPAMREWIGDKVIKDIRGYGFNLPNKDFEVTVGVKRKDIQDDQLGKYAILIPQLADEGTIKQDELLTTLRIAGDSTACYDGKMFYAANHQVGKSGSQSNLLTGTGHTLAQVQADFASVRAAFRKFKTDQAKPYIRQQGKLQLLVRIPADLESIFETLANASIISSTDNVLKGAFNYAVDSNLTDTDDWYVDYVGSRLRPFVMQMREEPHLVLQDDPKSDSVYTRGEYLFGNEARFNATYGLWPYSIKVSNA